MSATAGLHSRNQIHVRLYRQRVTALSLALTGCMCRPVPASRRPRPVPSPARPHPRARPAPAPRVRAARRRGGHGRLPVLPAWLLPLRGALLERAPPRRRRPPRAAPGPRYPLYSAPGRGGRGAARPGRRCGAERAGRVSAAASGSALAELSSDGGSGAQVL